ncbi:MAG: hypothetical protein PHU25_22625 [Deltaproteobacteria bacterium]|nr:hypothetical protein [Deltaproteobacteria bacterium]
MKRVLLQSTLAFAVAFVAACDQSPETWGDAGLPGPDADADTDSDADTDTDTDADTDGDSDGDTDTNPPWGTDDYWIPCCPDAPSDCSQIGSTNVEQEAGCCSGTTRYYCDAGAVQSEGCGSKWCAFEGGTGHIECRDTPTGDPCLSRDGEQYWDSEFPEFPAGTLCCDKLPASCGDIGDTPEKQYIGCCGAHTVYWCEGGVLHAEGCLTDARPCALVDNGLMWCMDNESSEGNLCADFQ